MSKSFFKIISLAIALIFSCKSSEAAPNIEIYVGQQNASTIGELRGALQVKADKTSVDALTGQIEANGHVVIVNSEKGRRMMILRADKAKFSSADAEFQIIDVVEAEFADGIALVNRALSDGHIEGYAQGALLQGIENNLGWDRYRLHYEGVGAGAGWRGDMAFDARNQILKIRESIVYADAEPSVDERIYCGVTVEILKRAVENSRVDKASNFRNLTNYGAELQRSSEP